MILYKDLKKYKKLDEWKYSKFTIPMEKTGDLVSRISFGNLPDSFFFACFYNHMISNKPPLERISIMEQIKEDGLDNIDLNHIFKYIDFHMERLIKEFEMFLETEVEYDIDELDVHRNLFDILRKRLLLNKENFLSTFRKQLESMKDVMDGEINFKSVEKIFHELYTHYASDELNSVEQSDVYTQETKYKFKENIKYTLRKIVEMLSDFLLDAYVDSVRTETPKNNTEFTMVFEHVKPHDYNILITEIYLDSKENISLRISKDLDFDKFINTDRRCIILLYFPEEQSYERLIYDSVEKPEQYLEKDLDYAENNANKQYPYRYYTFPYNHNIIQTLLESS